MLTGATIVFDLDGTLVDTAPGLTSALNHALQRRGHDGVAPALVRESAGRGARAMIEDALRALGAKDDVEAMLADFLRYYEANIAAASRPFPGAVAALDRLRSAGATLAICTNKRERLTHLLLQALEIEGYFDAVAGRDTFGKAKPDPAPLLGVVRAAGGSPARALMVGDSAVDIAAAPGGPDTLGPGQFRLLPARAGRSASGLRHRQLRCTRGSRAAAAEMLDREGLGPLLIAPYCVS